MVDWWPLPAALAAVAVWFIRHRFRRQVRAFTRWFLILIGWRRITPRVGEALPMAAQGGEGDAGDTGGGGWYRPLWRKQDPSADPKEPNGSESSGTGNDHGWSNCTMSSGAMALDFHTQGDLQKWGGDMRHKQGDLSGGTDLYDLRDAWAEYGESLTIRSGAGWSGVKDDRADGRAIVIQGVGNCPGSSTFDGGHACVISPETRDAGDWLFGDPLASGWQWVSESSIKAWAQAWAGSIAFASSAAHKPKTDPPDPVPVPVPPPAGPTVADVEAARTEGYGRGRTDGIEQGHTEGLDWVFADWDPGQGPPDLEGNRWDAVSWDGADWAHWPYPLMHLLAARVPAVWGGAEWTAALWPQDQEPPVQLTAGQWATVWSKAAWSEALQ